jgi:hypothetical protein
MQISHNPNLAHHIFNASPLRNRINWFSQSVAALHQQSRYIGCRNVAVNHIKSQHSDVISIGLAIFISSFSFLNSSKASSAIDNLFSTP